MTGIDTNCILIRRRFDAPPERVYAAWTSPGDLAVWAWGALSRDVDVEVDLRPGGRYRIATAVREDQPGGPGRAGMHGVYVEVEPNRRLVYTLHWDAPVGYNETGEMVLDEAIIVEFEAVGSGTDVTYTHLGVPLAEAAREHTRGIEHTLDVLAEHLASSP